MEETMETTVDTGMESTQEDLFDWGETEQGEEQQEQNDQSVSEADGEAGQGQPQAENAVDAQPAPEPEEATVTVKFYGKEQKLPMSQVQTLAQKGLIEEAGRLDLPGRPVSFRTTDVFLRTFGLRSLADLPPLHGDDYPLEMEQGPEEPAAGTAGEA